MKLEYDKLLSSFAFRFNLRPYIKTLIWCKSFLLEAKDGVEANNVIGVEPMPGQPSVHHMHLHVCNPDSESWKQHQRMYTDVDDTPPGRALLLTGGPRIPLFNKI